MDHFPALPSVFLSFPQTVIRIRIISVRVAQSLRRRLEHKRAVVAVAVVVVVGVAVVADATVTTATTATIATTKHRGHCHHHRHHRTLVYGSAFVQVCLKVTNSLQNKGTTDFQTNIGYIVLYD